MVTLTLPPEPASVASARAYVDEALDTVGIGPGTREPAVLLTSELVTNGIIHGRTDVEVRLDITEDAVRVEVIDGGAGCPVPENARPDADHGRGLMIVSRLASRWGVQLSSGGTVVWFELRCSGAPSPRRSPSAVDAIAGQARRFFARISPRS
jgi:anti-sigma regulatory factor (Ser/Thr protein kinase)